MGSMILLAMICISYGYVVWRIIRNATWQDRDENLDQFDSRTDEDRQ